MKPRKLCDRTIRNSKKEPKRKYFASVVPLVAAAFISIAGQTGCQKCACDSPKPTSPKVSKCEGTHPSQYEGVLQKNVAVDVGGYLFTYSGGADGKIGISCAADTEDIATVAVGKKPAVVVDVAKDGKKVTINRSAHSENAVRLTISVEDK